MLTKAYKISKIITSLTMFVGVLAIIIAWLLFAEDLKKQRYVNFMMNLILVNLQRKNLIF